MREATEGLGDAHQPPRKKHAAPFDGRRLRFFSLVLQRCCRAKGPSQAADAGTGRVNAGANRR